MPAPNTSIPAALGTGCPSQEGLDRTGSAGLPAALEVNTCFGVGGGLAKPLKWHLLGISNLFLPRQPTGTI